MTDTPNEILIAIQNGLFNEGIYRISEESTEVRSSEKESQHPEPKAEIIDEPKEMVREPEAVIQKEIKPEPEIIPSQKIEFLGANKKSVAVLVSYPDERWIYPKDKIILERILASVKLSFDDVAIINTQYFSPKSLDELVVNLPAGRIIGFATVNIFGDKITPDELAKTDKATVLMMRSSLEEIAMNVDLKRLLWNNLKLMFNIA